MLVSRWSLLVYFVVFSEPLYCQTCLLLYRRAPGVGRADAAQHLSRAAYAAAGVLAEGHPRDSSQACWGPLLPGGPGGVGLGSA